jgi:hypothetical protein
LLVVVVAAAVQAVVVVQGDTERHQVCRYQPSRTQSRWVVEALNEQTVAILLALALLQLAAVTAVLKLFLQTQRPLEVLVEAVRLFRTHQGLLVLQARAMRGVMA